MSCLGGAVRGGQEGSARALACVEEDWRRQERARDLDLQVGGGYLIPWPRRQSSNSPNSLGVLLRVLDVGRADGRAVVAQVARGVCCYFGGEAREEREGAVVRTGLDASSRARPSSSRGRRARSHQTPPSLTAVKAGCSGVPNTMCMKSAVASQAAVHMGARARGFDWGGGRGHERASDMPAKERSAWGLTSRAQGRDERESDDQELGHLRVGFVRARDASCVEQSGDGCAGCEDRAFVLFDGQWCGSEGLWQVPRVSIVLNEWCLRKLTVARRLKTHWLQTKTGGGPWCAFRSAVATSPPRGSSARRRRPHVRKSPPNQSERRTNPATSRNPEMARTYCTSSPQVAAVWGPLSSLHPAIIIAAASKRQLTSGDAAELVAAKAPVAAATRHGLGPPPAVY